MKISKMKKKLRNKKHKRELEKAAEFKAGELSGAKKEREKINAEKAFDNKNETELQKLKEKQKSDAVLREKNNIIKNMKEDHNRLVQQCQDYESLYKTENQPLEDRIADHKKELEREIKKYKDHNDDWECSIEETEKILKTIIHLSSKFEPTFLDALKIINNVRVIAGEVEDMYNYLRNLRKKQSKNRGMPLSKIPRLKIKTRI